MMGPNERRYKKNQKKTARERKIIPFCRKKGLNISECSQKTYIKK
jgi:hypothetical protein